MVKVNDVIQLDPAQCKWGPLLCIVDEVKSWGVRCYALLPDARDRPPNPMYLRVDTGKFQVIGTAEWILPVIDLT
jgi:hypothetical protein